MPGTRAAEHPFRSITFSIEARRSGTILRLVIRGGNCLECVRLRQLDGTTGAPSVTVGNSSNGRAVTVDACNTRDTAIGIGTGPHLLSVAFHRSGKR